MAFKIKRETFRAYTCILTHSLTCNVKIDIAVKVGLFGKGDPLRPRGRIPFALVANFVPIRMCLQALLQVITPKRIYLVGTRWYPFRFFAAYR